MHAQRRDDKQGTVDYARPTSTLSRSRTPKLGLFFYNCLYYSTDLDVLNCVSFVSAAVQDKVTPLIFALFSVKHLLFRLRILTE